MTTQIKTTEPYFSVVVFITLYKVVLTFESADEILKCDIQMKAIEHYFPVVITILYNAALTVESVDEILKCDHSNENYGAVLCYDTVCFSIFL